MPMQLSHITSHGLDEELKLHEVKKITANTLVLTGRDDIGTKPKMSEELSKLIAGSQFKIIKKGKHLCNIECSEYFNVTLRKFIDNNAQT